MSVEDDEASTAGAEFVQDSLRATVDKIWTSARTTAELASGTPGTKFWRSPPFGCWSARAPCILWPLRRHRARTISLRKKSIFNFCVDREGATARPGPFFADKR